MSRWSYGHPKSASGQKNIGKNQVDTYYFDVEKCKFCSLKEGCYKEGGKTKTYSVVIKSYLHQEQVAFQETDYFKEKAKHRYKIEAKNSELKNVHGYDRAISYGITNMQMQGAIAIFAVNLKRILRLMQENKSYIRSMQNELIKVKNRLIQPTIKNSYKNKTLITDI